MRAMLMLNCDHSQKAYFGITYQWYAVFEHTETQSIHLLFYL